MKTFEGDIEEMAAESAQDRRDHARLQRDLEWLLAHDGAMRVPLATRKLVDLGVDPLVIAKSMLIGDRDGGPMYKLTNRAAQLEQHEAAALDLLSFARRDCPIDVLAVQLLAGAVWLAEQFALSRSTLRELVQQAAPRDRLAIDARGCGVVDIVDRHGVKDRAWLVDAIDHAQLPMFAPLEFQR